VRPDRWWLNQLPMIFVTVCWMVLFWAVVVARASDGRIVLRGTVILTVASLVCGIILGSLVRSASARLWLIRVSVILALLIGIAALYRLLPLDEYATYSALGLVLTASALIRPTEVRREI
jgi:hypothetical protein